MAAITKTSWAGFIPVLWAQSILDQVRANIILARLVARDYENELAGLGDTVRIGKIGTLSAVDKVAGTSVTRQASTGSSQDLVLDKHKIVPFVVEDVARAQANPDAMVKQTAEAARALAEQLESDLFAAIVAAAGTTVGTAGTDASTATLLLVRKALADAKCPQGAPKHAIWATKDANALLGVSANSIMVKANERGDAGEALREGQLGRAYGLEHYESTMVNVVAGSPATTQNVAFTPGAVQLAVRPINAQSPGMQSAFESDPVSGLAVRVTAGYDMDAVGMAMNVELLYGIKVVRPEWTVLART